MRAPLLSAAVAIVLIAYPSPATAREPTDDIDAYLAERMDATNVPGAAASVIEGEEVTYSRQWGHSPDGNAITARTPFLWGSVAKPITATIVLGLAEDGELDVDDPVTTHLKGFHPTWQGGKAAPTIAQLLSHTAGLPGIGSHDVTDRADDRPDAVSRVAEELSDVELASRPGSTYAYTSLDYILLGAVVEELTGKTFSQVAQERVFQPLGAEDVITDASAADRLPGGHRLWFGHPVGYTEAYDNSGVPYGYMAGDITALTRFAGAASRHDALVSPKTWRRAQSPHTPTGSGEYGYGWSIHQWHDETMLFHTGGTAGFHTNVIVLPQRDIAVVLLQNANGEAAAAPLRTTAEGIASIVSGSSPEASEGPDPTLSIAPWALTATALVLFGASLFPVRRTGRLRAIAWGASAVAIPLALLLGVPLISGIGLRFLWLFTPDLVLGLYAVAAGAFTLGVRRTVPALRRRTSVSHTPAHTHQDTELTSARYSGRLRT